MDFEKLVAHILKEGEQLRIAKQFSNVCMELAHVAFDDEAKEDRPFVCLIVRYPSETPVLCRAIGGTEELLTRTLRSIVELHDENVGATLGLVSLPTLKPHDFSGDRDANVG